MRLHEWNKWVKIDDELNNYDGFMWYESIEIISLTQPMMERHDVSMKNMKYFKRNFWWHKDEWARQLETDFNVIENIG